MTKVRLAGEEIELRFTHKRMDIIEKQIGSLYSYPDKCALKTVTISDIVCIYYNAQDKTAYNEEVIFDKIMADGLMTHITLTYDVIMPLIFTEDVMKEVEDNSKKK